MKALLTIMVLVQSSLTFAGEYPAFVELCRPGAIQKLQAQAEHFNANLDLNSVEVAEIQRGIRSPVKAVWFVGVGVQAGGGQVQLEALMEKSPFSSCR